MDIHQTVLKLKQLYYSILKFKSLILYRLVRKRLTTGKNGKVHSFKGCGMGPWLVLVSPCFRENVVATYKIGSFLCILDNLLQKNVIVLFFENQISKWRSFEKKGYF